MANNPSGGAASILPHNHPRVAELFRALSEPNRLSIVHCLADGPHRVGEIAQHVGLAQSTVSAHLAVLKEAGITTARAEGRSTWYQLNVSGVAKLLEAAEQLIRETEGIPHA